MAENQIPANIAVLTAPQLFGALFNWALYGILLSQTYSYYVNFRNDRPVFKILVYGLFMAETAQTGIIGRDVFESLAKGWGDLSVLFNIETQWLTAPVFDGIIGAIVQIFYGWRIYLLTKSRILLGIIVTLALTAGSTGIYVGAISTVPNDAFLLERTYRVGIAWLVCGALCDIVISLCMIIWYFRIRQDLAYSNTDDVVVRVVQYTVVSGLFTTTVAIVDLILLLTFRSESTTYYQCPSLVIGKLYTNSLVAMLNQRSRSRDDPALQLFEFDSQRAAGSRTKRSQQSQLSDIGFSSPRPGNLGTTATRTRSKADAVIELKSMSESVPSREYTDKPSSLVMAGPADGV